MLGSVTYAESISTPKGRDAVSRSTLPSLLLVTVKGMTARQYKRKCSMNEKNKPADNHSPVCFHKWVEYQECVPHCYIISGKVCLLCGKKTEAYDFPPGVG